MEIPYVCLWSGEGSYKKNPFAFILQISLLCFQQYHKDYLAHHCICTHWNPPIDFCGWLYLSSINFLILVSCRCTNEHNGAQTFTQGWTWQNRCLLRVTLTHCSRRDLWFPCLLPRDTAVFHPSCSSQVVKQLYQSSSETYLNPSSALSYFLRLLVFIIAARKHTMLWKGIVSRSNSFPHKKDSVSPCFLFIGQGWFMRFLHPAHIHVIKKTSSRCSAIWSSMNSWKGSWGFPGFEEQVKSQSRGSRKLGFLYSPPNNLFQLGWGFEGKGKTILVLSNLRENKWSI